ncbi:MAG TPA: DegT/DnrJ/EryC1/StrS family aminotransferase [Pyrinomonadaceae bacterium]|nr:DegT/DnrJ/EryC1/StrS family aminotransferase [Pyrinomonadaceae bacterium]
MNVPLLDLRAQYGALRERVREAVDRVFESQGFVLGPEVEALEEEVAHYSQARHAIACASGSDALLLALMALDVKPGDEVITTPHTFFATASAITRLGARPIFVDVDPQTYNINPSLIEGAITKRTRAIMPVHIYGQCAEMDEILSVAARHSIPVVEDAAQAIGAEDKERRAGSMGAIGCFSFYPSKNLGGAGDGGMLTTNDDRLAERLRMLHVHGGVTKYHHTEVGINSRLDAIQAVVLRAKLPHLDEWSDARARHAQRYRDLFSEAGLTEKIVLPFVREDARHIFHLFIIRAGRERDALMNHLRENGVGTEVYYPVPLHLQECFRYLGYSEGDFPESESAARETLALPIYPELSDEQLWYVVDVIRQFFPE